MSSENVVLAYPHPHVMVYVEDNTVYKETYLTPDEPIKLIQCGAFASGRDNQLIYCEGLGEFLHEFGNPNYKLYGQPGYNISATLSTGYAAAYVMRVMPEDATYSNLVILANYKVEETDTGEVDENGDPIMEKKLHIGFSSTSITNATTVAELDAAVTALIGDPADDGTITRPLFYVYQKGRGTYGNATRIRFADVTAYDDPDNTYFSYRLDVLRMADTLVRDEYVFGSLNPDLFDNYTKESLYLEDLINDPESGLGKVSIGVLETTLNELLDVVNSIQDEEPFTLSTLDILFGKNLDGTNNNKIVLYEPDNAVDLTKTEGLSLYNGSEGSFDTSNPSRDDAITECLVKAYAGEYDKMIKSRFSSPADFMLDANFDSSVKRQMVALAKYRQYDAMCYIDSGFASTVDEEISWLEEYEQVWGNNVLKVLHHFKIRDVEYTGKTIPVTFTYHLASLIPTHLKVYGLDVPMALENARITNAVKGSFLPVIDPDENDIKSALYKLRGNYCETVGYGVYQRGVCITSQKETSDRLDEFNEYILHLAVKIASDIMYSKIYKFGEPDDRTRYQKDANDRLNRELGKYVRSISVNFEMSKDDERRNIMRIVLRIVFKTVVKRGVVEVYLDPRA